MHYTSFDPMTSALIIISSVIITFIFMALEAFINRI